MKIVFFGSSEFSVPSLEALIAAGYDVACVVTRQDKRSGRGMHVSSTPVKDAALKLGLSVYQPEEIKSRETIDYLKKFSSDLFVVIAYGRILPSSVLAIPRIFSINLHASLLPKYRGSAPINWVIINGEKKTGVTMIKMDESVDTGEIISQNEVIIEPTDNARTLGDKLSRQGAELLVGSIRSIENGKFRLTPQDNDKATFAPKMKKEDGLIDWEEDVDKIYNLIRGCYGWPGAFTYYKGKLVKIINAEIHSIAVPGRPGEITGISRQGVIVSAKEGGLLIEKLQVEGKTPVAATAFIAGYRIKHGESFENKRRALNGL